MKEIEIKTTAKIPLERVGDLLVSAFEGSNYWYTIEGWQEPPAFEFRYDEAQIYEPVDYPLNRYGNLEISDPDGGLWDLTLPAIQRGLQLLADEYPQHWDDFQNHNADASTGDVFLQLCLFGKVVYG